MAWSKLVDLAYTPDESEKMMGGLSEEARPMYPPGLCICLNQDCLEKLGLDTDCDVGDLLDARIFGTVTAVSKRGDSCHVEVQIEKMAVENEMSEDMDED